MFLKNASLGDNRWHLYLATVILVVVGYSVGQLPLLAVLLAKAAQGGIDQAELEELASSLDFSNLEIDQNLVVSLMLLTFVTAFAFLWAGVRFIHKKPFGALVNPTLKINWRKIFFSFGLWMALMGLLELVFYLLRPDIYSFQFDASSFFVLLLIALLLFPLQTSFEELFFRGYLMQGLSLVSKYRWVPLLATSVGFGAMHLMNPEVKAFGLGISMTYYIGVGLFLGILTLMDDGLELALGVHAATNIFGALFVTFDDSAIQTAALFHAAEVNIEWMLAGFAVAAVAFTAVVSKKYNWQSWSNCYGAIEKPQSGENFFS